MFISVATAATLHLAHVGWLAIVGSVVTVETILAILVMTIAIERTRKRAVRRILELAFINHHVHNALAQIVMSSEIADVAIRDRYIQESVSRISEALLRSENDYDLAGLTLDVDLGGKRLNRERQQREDKSWARGA